MSCEAPCKMNASKNTLQRRLMRNVLEGGVSSYPLMAIKEIGLKECRGRCISVGGVSIVRVQDLPERNTAEDRGL